MKKLIGIIVLVIAVVFAYQYFFQGNRLVNNLISYPSSTYSLVRLDPKKSERVRVGDVLTGKGVANAQVYVNLNPGGNRVEVKTDKEGYFNYKIPKNIKPGEYKLLIEIENRLKYLVNLKSYKLKIDSNSKYKFLNLNLVKPKDVYAQSIPPQAGTDYANWVTQMQAIGVYPAYENGEITLYNRQQYEAKYCNLNPCMFNAPTLERMISTTQTDEDFLKRLMIRLYDNNYAPFAALEPYFPGIQDLGIINPTYYDTVRLQIRKPGIKTEIDENSLKGYMQSVMNDIGLAEHYKNNPFEAFIVVTDPIFGTHALVKWLTLPPSQLSDSDRVQALFALTGIYGLTEKVGVAAGRDFLKFTSNLKLKAQAIAEARQLKTAIKNGESVPLSALENRAKRWVENISSLTPIDTGKLTMYRLNEYLASGKSVPHFITNRGNEVWRDIISPLIDTGNVYIIPRDDPQIIGIYYAISQLKRQIENKTGRALPRAFADQIGATPQVFIIPNSEMTVISGATGGPSGGFANAEVIVLAESEASMNGLFHEHVHINGNLDRIISEIGGTYNITQNFVGFKYFGNTEKDRFLTIFFELMTDGALTSGRIGDVSYLSIPPSVSNPPFFQGSTIRGFYTLVSPELASALQNRLFVKYPELLYDSLEFAFTGNGDAILARIAQNEAVQKYAQIHGLQSTSDFEKVHKFLNDGKGIDFSAVTPLAVGAVGTGGLVDPTFSINQGFVKPDYDHLTDDLDKDVRIDQVNGDLRAGNTLTVSSSVYSDSGSADTSQLYETWGLSEAGIPTSRGFKLIKDAQAFSYSAPLPTKISEVTPLVGGVICQGTCNVRIPADLPSGNYKLVAFLRRLDSDYVLSTDTYDLSIQAQPTLAPSLTPEPTLTLVPTPELLPTEEVTPVDEEPTQEPTLAPTSSPSRISCNISVNTESGLVDLNNGAPRRYKAVVGESYQNAFTMTGSINGENKPLRLELWRAPADGPVNGLRPDHQCWYGEDNSPDSCPTGINTESAFSSRYADDTEGLVTSFDTAGVDPGTYWLACDSYQKEGENVLAKCSGNPYPSSPYGGEDGWIDCEGEGRIIVDVTAPSSISTPTPTITPTFAPLNVTTCNGRYISYETLESELRLSNYPGPYGRAHVNEMLLVFNVAACPSPTPTPVNWTGTCTEDGKKFRVTGDSDIKTHAKYTDNGTSAWEGEKPSFEHEVDHRRNFSWYSEDTEVSGIATYRGNATCYEQAVSSPAPVIPIEEKSGGMPVRLKYPDGTLYDGVGLPNGKIQVNSQESGFPQTQLTFLDGTNASTSCSYVRPWDSGVCSYSSQCAYRYWSKSGYQLFDVVYNSGWCGFKGSEFTRSIQFTFPSNFILDAAIDSSSEGTGSILNNNPASFTLSGYGWHPMWNVFIKVPVTLTVNKSSVGSGTITSSDSLINCGLACTKIFTKESSNITKNTLVALTANPSTGSVFSSWTGCDSTNRNTCSIRMNNNKIITANFNQAPTPTPTPTPIPVLTVNQNQVNKGETIRLTWDNILSTVYVNFYLSLFRADGSSGSAFKPYEGDTNCHVNSDNKSGYCDWYDSEYLPIGGLYRFGFYYQGKAIYSNTFTVIAPTQTPTQTPTNIPIPTPTPIPTAITILMPTRIPTPTRILPTPTPIPVLTVSTNSVKKGDKVTVNITNIYNPGMYDWLGLFKEGTNDDYQNSLIGALSIKSDPRCKVNNNTGSCEFTITNQFIEGAKYEFRLFTANGTKKTTTSSQVAIIASTPTPTLTRIPTLTMTPVPTSIPIPSSNCLLTSAAWSVSSLPVREGDLVKLMVTSSGNCRSQIVNFEVRRNGLLDDPSVIAKQPKSMALVNNKAVSSWTAEHNPLIPSTDPDYYFKVNIVGKTNTMESNPRFIKVLSKETIPQIISPTPALIPTSNPAMRALSTSKLSCNLTLNLPYAFNSQGIRVYQIQSGKTYQNLIQVKGFYEKKSLPLSLTLERSAPLNSGYNQNCWYGTQGIKNCPKDINLETVIGKPQINNASSLTSDLYTINTKNIPSGSYYLKCSAYQKNDVCITDPFNLNTKTQNCGNTSYLIIKVH